MTPNRNDQPVVIITGSSGLIGERLIWDLRHEFQIIGFDRDGEPQPPKEVECVCVDVTDSASVELGLQRVAYAYGKRLASFVHLAAYYDFSDEESPLYDEVTVEGTRRLIRELQRQQFEVEQFLFSSTMLVHKPGEPGRPIDESWPLQGKWPYPKSKIRTEEMLRQERGDVPVVLMRIAGVYTDEGRAPAVVNQIARIHQRSLKAHLYSGNTSRGQAYVHLNDTVAAIRQAIEHRRDLSPVEPLLIAEPETYSYETLQRALGELLHGEPGWTTHTVPQTLARAGAWMEDKASALPGIDEPFIKPFMIAMADDHYEVDISKARRLLGWEPQHRLIDTLPKMVDALRKDPAAWYRRHRITMPRDVEQAATERK